METNILRDFFVISHWQTILVIFAMITGFVIIWMCTKKFKLKFQYRILLGFLIGLIIGFSVSGGAGFPDADKIKNLNTTKNNDLEWLYQSNSWYSLFSSMFISGLKIMVIPIVFLALARIFAKKTKSNLSKITFVGIGILLVNVAIAFTITFWLGYWMNISSSLSLKAGIAKESTGIKKITTIFANYMPGNFFSVLSGGIVIIPTLILGAIVGYAIKKSSKKFPNEMSASQKTLDTFWKISISVIMFVIKFMPYIVLVMISKAIFNRPISEFQSIGEIIFLGYLGLIITYGFQLFTVWIFGINTLSFIKKGFKPLTNGFLTQSSVATLPIAISTLKDDMELGEKAHSPNVIMPLSTTMGLAGCAGVQSGVILIILKNSIGSPITMNVGIFFLIGLIVTIFTSLGIAGVPGTATIVTIGIITTMGFPTFVNPVTEIISPLNGIFDMGRTAVNVNGGVQASLIASKIEGELPESMLKKPFAFLKNLKNYKCWTKYFKNKKNKKNKKNLK